MKTVRRMAVIAALSLASGILANQFMNDGIPWRLLVPSMPGRPAAARIRMVDAEKAFDLLHRAGVRFLDVRTPDEFRIDHIPGAVNVPFISFFRHPAKILQPPPRPDETIVVYDFESGSRKARMAAQWLARNRFTGAAVLYPGFSGWLETGRPVERGNRP
jgi:rhodanese-related sulfurtransferase